MVERTYKASLSQSQGREGWSIIFRHPVRIDPATGKPGRRVRQGLGTRDKEEAAHLVDEMNEILADPTFWEASARSRAERVFDSRVVDIFYYELVPEIIDFSAIRDSVIPLPSSTDTDYRRVLFVGTTGGGKTTLVRQLLGTDPRRERFPATSTAKTTIADMELLLDQGLYRAVVTFLALDQVRDYIEECISSAVLAAYRSESDGEVLRRLLNHVSQRFRLTYVLGNGGHSVGDNDIDPDEDESGSEGFSAEELKLIDLDATNSILKTIVGNVRKIADRHGESLRAELGAAETDERIIEELFEENLDHLLRDDDEFQSIADQLLDEVKRRFELLSVGEISKTKQGWPRLWRWETNDRGAFIKAVLRFSSNYAPFFGTLLTPLVNGVRVAGPFKPEWSDRQPRFVLLDGEGLGHTPESSASLPTSMSRRVDDVDAVLLVDNATQPMQAAPVAVMGNLASSGRTSKLLTCFTHFDIVVGDNLPTFQAKEQHVLASVGNVLTGIGEQLGPFAKRALQKRFRLGCFFVGGIDQVVDTSSRRGKRTIDQLLRLLESIDTIIQRPKAIASTPIYDRANLVLAVREATESFHDAWNARLGHQYKSDIHKAHWATVKALSRRLAEGWADEWSDLRPVADLHKELKNKVYLFIQNPVEWEGANPTDDEKQQMFDHFAAEISSRALDIATRRIRFERVTGWQQAYNQRGRGSTFDRATIITEEVYEKAAPIPNVAPSPDRNKFLHEVLEAVEEAAGTCNIKLR